MIEKIFKKINYILGFLSIAALLCLVVFLTNIEIRSFDLWLHLKSGQFIIQNGFIPSVDVFSCTVFGQPWNNHEWLFQIVSYSMFSLFGFDGVSSMQSLVIGFTFMFLLFLGDIRKRQLTTVFLLLLVGLSYQSRFTIRPDIFSLLFLTIYIYLLQFHLSRKWSILFFASIQILWVNTHGFFIFGPGIILMYICSEFIKRRTKLPWSWNVTNRLNDQEYHFLKVIFLVTFLVSIANPQLVKGLTYPFEVLLQMTGESKVFFGSIQELARPLSWSTLLSLEYIYYKLLILISFVSFVVNYKRVNFFHLILWAFFLVLSTSALRNMVYFSFIAFWVSVSNFKNIYFEQLSRVFKNRENLRYIGLIILKIVLIIWMFHYGYQASEARYYDFKNYEMKSAFGGVSGRNFPTQAVNFLNKNNIKGNFFNDFNSGAYLIGNCFPDIRVFIDGRTELYGPKFFNEYKKIWDQGDKVFFDTVAKKYHLTGVFLNSAFHEIPKKLLREIYDDDHWILVYLDYDAVIFLKDIDENKDFIKNLRLDKNSISFSETNVQELGLVRVSPYQQIKRARVLEILDFDELALNQVQQALLIAPGYGEPYFIRGKIYLKQKKYKEAFEDFRIAAMILPGDSDIRYYLALGYENLGNLKEAIKHCEWLVKKGTKSNKVFLTLSKMYVETGRFSQSVKILKKAKDFSAEEIAELLTIGDFLLKENQIDFAKDVYAIALKADPTSSLAQQKMDQCLKQ
ncbi:MAG: hypothetical protein PHY73_06340 [Candidatus Omnitrophica bacterium]|nr:hypothetical protein [Candidatus Omnitrophota bacterium]